MSAIPAHLTEFSGFYKFHRRENVDPKLHPPLIPIERIDQLLQLEPLTVILALAAGAWIIYKLFLRNVSTERHQNLVGQFKNLAWHIGFFSIFGALYVCFTHLLETDLPLERLSSYLGLMTLIQGAVVFVKTARILIFEYLFLSHMRVAVPLLVVNLFTLLLTLAISAWIIGEVFSIRLAPLLATSAVFSLVLGLALQDTLGNLFAGVALQIDKPYEMGDWIEIQSSGQKWIGQVHEISWRATVLTGFGGELITVPNRTISQAQVSTYVTRIRPIARNQLFRLPFDSQPKKVKATLLQAALSVPGVSHEVEPLVLLSETTESWVTYKLIYYISEFGLQYVTADRVLDAALASLKNEKIDLAPQRLALFNGAHFSDLKDQ